MRSVNLFLDPAFQPTGCRDDLKCQQFSFPAGEQHVKLSGDCATQDVWISERIKSGDDFMRLALAVDAVRNMRGNPCVFLGYLPYARQDRVMVSGEAHSLRVFCTLLKSLKVSRLRIFDPHSDVAAALLPGVEVVDNSRFIHGVLTYKLASIVGNVTMVAPDAGALKKIYGLCKKIEFTGPVAVGTKLRDTATGNIVRASVDGDIDGRDCLIVDDIIDGGRTFLELAKQLRERGARSVRLAVSHGIFSQGTKHLRDVLDAIFVTNSYSDRTDSEHLDFVQHHQLGFDG